MKERGYTIVEVKTQTGELFRETFITPRNKKLLEYQILDFFCVMFGQIIDSINEVSKKMPEKVSFFGELEALFKEIWELSREKTLKEIIYREGRNEKLVFEDEEELDRIEAELDKIPLTF